MSLRFWTSGAEVGEVGESMDSGVLFMRVDYQSFSGKAAIFSIVTGHGRLADKTANSPLLRRFDCA